MKKIAKFLIIIFLVVILPFRTNSAEILQINSSSRILVGDQNRSISIKLICVETEFPRGSKVKIKPIGIRDNIWVAKVFDINESKEMSELLISQRLTKEICPN